MAKAKPPGIEVVGEFENCSVSVHHGHQLVMARPGWAPKQLKQKSIEEIKKDFHRTAPSYVKLAPKWMRAMVYGLEKVGLLKLYSDRTWKQAQRFVALSASTGHTWPFAEEIDKAYEEGFRNGQLSKDLEGMGLASPKSK